MIWWLLVFACIVYWVGTRMGAAVDDLGGSRSDQPLRTGRKPSF